MTPPRSSGSAGRIVGFGTYETAKHPRVGILIDGLRAHGHDVVEVNHPLGLSTAERVRILQQPWRVYRLVLRLLSCWLRLVRDARAVVRDERPVDAVVVGYLGHFDVVLARILFRRTPIVLDHLVFAGDTARDRGASGFRVKLLRRLDRLALACSDIHVVDTDEHLEMLPRPDRGVVVPVGAREEWYEAAREAGTSTSSVGDRLRVIFFGLFTPLQGAPVIARAVARALEEGAPLQVTMVGSGQDHARARQLIGGTTDVTWIPWVEPEQLPTLVAAHDVCLGIFADVPKALRVVPNKVYEGLAAGCAVVTSDTSPQRRALGDSAVLVPPSDSRALAEALHRLAGDPEALAAARRRAARGALRFRSDQVVAPLLERLASVMAR